MKARGGSLTYLIKMLEDEQGASKFCSLGYIAYSLFYRYCCYHNLEYSKANFKAIIKAVEPDYGDEIIDKEGVEYSSLTGNQLIK